MNAQYGQIHVCVRELVQEKFGNETWTTVLNKAALDEHDHFLVFHRYDDATTFKLIGAVCETLNADLPTVLEIFGEYFLQYCLRHGYDKMLRTLGGNFTSFIQNLDSLHSLLALTYRNIEAPSFSDLQYMWLYENVQKKVVQIFLTNHYDYIDAIYYSLPLQNKCETNDDGTLALHYYTIRPGLYPIVLGLVKAVARDLYNQEAEISVVGKSQQKIEGGKTQEHVHFQVVLNSKDELRPVSVFKPAFPSEFIINAEQFCNAFPYHIVFDSDLRIKQCGMTIQKMLGIPVHDRQMCDLFELIHPRMEMAVLNIRMFINAVFMVRAKVKNSKKVKNGESGTSLVLKGQMMWLEDIGHMIFISSPRLSSLTELMEMNVYLADIPLYDVTRELVLLNQQRIAEIDIAKRLDETTTELRKTSKALEEEKKKTERLLYQMLPERVAESLKNGRTVEAEKFDQVTILFSDIVTFTSIAAACPAMAVVKMLNDMYNRFDSITNVHGVYKVETIGDAYMIVCGVPVKTTDHAQPVADFALDMIEEAAKVVSPATGKPLQIRIGIHTGPVVAGVVGMKMPRYCLFGDTVNTASRMESHGVPGRIHLSSSTFEHMGESKQYVFRSRGEIDVKGKGKMVTYFLLGTASRLVVEPQDQFQDLPMTSSSSIPDPLNISTVSKTRAAVKNSSSTCTVL